jgi:hypothetical protein
MRCSGTARGFGFGSGTVFAAASDRVTLHTNPNAVTSGRTRGTRFQPTAADSVGRRRPCPRHSTHSRKCKTICPLYVATSRRAGSGCAVRKDLCSSLRRVPKQLTIWMRRSRELEFLPS